MRDEWDYLMTHRDRRVSLPANVQAQLSTVIDAE
jgi:hypothetical protein